MKHGFPARPVTALVLAGSRGLPDPMAERAGVSHKALLPIAGIPMLIRVLNAIRPLRVEGHIGRIVVSTEHPDMLDSLAAQGFAVEDVEFLKASGSPSQSVAQALETLGVPLFVTTADHALLKPEWIAYFLDSIPPQADIAVALARAKLVMAAAPDTKRTFLRFHDGAFSGCNLFFLANPKAAQAVTFWRHAEASRKHPVRLARLLGLHVMLRYALGLLTRNDVLNRLSRLTSAKAVFVDMPFGECAIDVDKAEDLELAERLAKARL